MHELDAIAERIRGVDADEAFEWGAVGDGMSSLFERLDHLGKVVDDHGRMRFGGGAEVGVDSKVDLETG